MDGYVYQEKMTLAKMGVLLSTPSNICVILQVDSGRFLCDNSEGLIMHDTTLIDFAMQCTVGCRGCSPQIHGNDSCLFDQL